jgi:hypothetical protein
MKLYATTTSERASKGQGGNDFLEIVLLQEVTGERVNVGKVIMEQGKVHFLYNEISDDVIVTLNGSRINEKSEKQKGEYCNECMSTPCQQ